MSDSARSRLAATWRRHRFTALGVIAALTTGIVFVWPLFANPWFETHDMIAYPVRAIEYVEAWKAGAWWPRWAPDLYGGFGYPLFNYYAPGLFMVSGLLMMVGASAVLALKLALALFTAAGATGMFAAVYGESRRVDAAVVAAAVFVCFGYHVTLVYVRGDLAEYCATCLAPSVIWAYRALGRVPAQRVPRMAIVAALSQAATLLVHTLTGQWLTEFLVIIVGVTAISAWRRNDRARVFVLAVTFVAACGLTAIYSIPALLERPLVHIERMIAGGLATTHNMVVSPHDLWTHGFFYAGWPVVLLPLAAVAALARRRRWLGDVIGWTLLTAAVVVAFMPISTSIWAYLPFGRYIQFPWRFLAFVSVFGALGIGACWRWLVPERAVIALPLAVLAVAATGYDGWRSLPARIGPMSAERVPADASAVLRQRLTTVISDEYLPRGVVSPPVNDTGYVLHTDRADLASALRSRSGYRLEISAKENGNVDVRAFWFPGWKVKTLSGPANARVEMSPGGLVRVVLPKAGYYQLRIYFGLTWFRAAAAMVSLLALLALALVPAWWLRRRGVVTAAPSAG